MIKFYLFSIILGILVLAGNAMATVGGPTYISEIAFKVGDDSVYYKVHDGGGRGCPPITHKINLTTSKDSEVKSCDEFETEDYNNEESSIKAREQFMANIYKDLSYLGSISLKKNNIDVQVEFLSEHIEFDYLSWSEFRATLTQDGKEIGKINFRGCSKDQPNVFEGYMIPNSDKIAILISGKGDCFEGGYIKETLHPIKGIKYYDKNIVRSIKQAGATEPNLGNAVVYATLASEPSIPETEPVLEAPEKDSSSNIPYVILGVVLALGLGYFLGRKGRR